MWFLRPILPSAGWGTMNDSIKNHLESHWKVSATRVPWAPGPRPPQGRGVLVFPAGPVHPFWIYATEGMSGADQKDPLEIFLCSAHAVDSHIELLSAVATYHQQEHALGIGHTVNLGRPWLPESLCTYGLVSLPYLDGPALEWLRRPIQPAIRFGWLIPITAAERDFKVREGLEELEKRFEKNLDYLNPKRESVVTEA